MKRPLSQKLDSEIKKQKDLLVRLTGDLIRQKTVNPPGNEWRAARVVKAFFKKHKIPCKKFEKQKGRENLVAEVGKGKPRLVIAAHLDVVPAGSGWKSDPFKPVVKKNKLIGRGVADNKGQAAALMVLAAAAKKFEKELPCTLVPVFAADEEAGSSMGLEFLLDKKHLKGDFAIVPDTGGHLKTVTLAEKGYLDVRIESLGRQAHSSTPEKGMNAILKLAELLLKIEKHKFSQKKHSLLSPMTQCTAMIRGGSAPNMVPASASATLNIRHVPGQTPAKIKKEIAALGKKVKGGKFKITMPVSMSPIEVKRDHPILEKLLQQAPKNVRLTGIGGTSVAKQFVKNGIPAIGYSCGGDEAFHQANESISIPELFRFTRILGKFLGSL